MALTDFQKSELDRTILNHIDELFALEKFTNEMVIDMISNDVSFANKLAPCSIFSAFQRLYFNAQNNFVLSECGYLGTKKAYSLDSVDFILTEKISKDKNILTFINGIEDGENITFNFIDRTWSKPMKVDEVHLHWKLKEVYDNLNTMLNYEWMFNYTTDLYTICDIMRLPKEMYETCPKGFIQYLEKTNKTFNCFVLKDYYLKSKYGVAGFNLRESFGDELGDWLTENGLVKNLVRCIVANTKNCIFESAQGLRTCLYHWKDAMEIKGEKIFLDEGKSLHHNKMMFDNIIDAEKNVRLAEQLQKLNFINGLSSKGLCVVVPQTQDEKKIEGENQHNCVGYYYDDSILEGRNFIFFIRKSANVNHSYITCRYNYFHKRVVEFKGFANSTVTDKEALIFIHEIEEIINDNFSKLA